jgi:hypothetical protein
MTETRDTNKQGLEEKGYRVPPPPPRETPSSPKPPETERSEVISLSR